MTIRKLPKTGTLWEHKVAGTAYVVLALTNVGSSDPLRYPVTVIYQSKNGAIWSRPIDTWYDSFTEVHGLTGTSLPFQPLLCDVALLNMAQDRLFDLLLPEDGNAEKEARRYLERERPDLYQRYMEATQQIRNKKEEAASWAKFPP